MSKNPDKTTPATANAGTEQNIAADVDEVMRKYDRRIQHPHLVRLARHYH